MDIVNKTIENDEEYLRQISLPVSFDNDDYKKDIELLEKFCLSRELFALAAVQIGIPKRIMYFRLTNPDLELKDNPDYNEGKVMINPVVISRKGHTKYWEACVSCLDNTALVNRPYEIEIEYFDANNIKHAETINGFEATVFSHEMDHLDGILHMDIAEQILIMTKEERVAFRRQHPYKIISKTGDYKDSSANNRG